MAERRGNLRQELILAGIDEINAHGVTGFSIRRVAEACNISCAAPYKHFKNKHDFIAAILDFANEQWFENQRQILSHCDGMRQKVVAVAEGYIRFLMDKPFFRSIVMLGDGQPSALYGRQNVRQFGKDIFGVGDWDDGIQLEKMLMVRAIVFGSIVMLENGELVYNEQTMKRIRGCIEREFDRQ